MAFIKGHYVDSGLTPDEREVLDRQAQEENHKLKSWDDVPLTREDQEER